MIGIQATFRQLYGKKQLNTKIKKAKCDYYVLGDLLTSPDQRMALLPSLINNKMSHLPTIMLYSCASGVISFDKEAGLLTLFDSLSNGHNTFMAEIVEYTYPEVVKSEELRLLVIDRFKDPVASLASNIFVYPCDSPISLNYDNLFANRAIRSSKYGEIRAQTQKLLVMASMHSTSRASGADEEEEEKSDHPFEQEEKDPFCLPILLSQGASILQVDGPGMHDVPFDSAVELAVQALVAQPAFALVTNSLNAGFVIRSTGITSIIPPLSTVAIPIGFEESGRSKAMWWVSLPGQASRLARTAIKDINALEADIAVVKHRALANRNPPWRNPPGRTCRELSLRVDILRELLHVVLLACEGALVSIKTAPNKWWGGTVEEECASIVAWRCAASDEEQKLDKARETLACLRKHELRLRKLYDNELRPRLLASSS